MILDNRSKHGHILFWNLEIRIAPEIAPRQNEWSLDGPRTKYLGSARDSPGWTP